MTTTVGLWMTREAHTQLQNELADLRSRPNIEDFSDYDDHPVANYTARQARIRQIQELLGTPWSARIRPMTVSPSQE